MAHACVAGHFAEVVQACQLFLNKLPLAAFVSFIQVSWLGRHGAIASVVGDYIGACACLTRSMPSPCAGLLNACQSILHINRFRQTLMSLHVQAYAWGKYLTMDAHLQQAVHELYLASPAGTSGLSTGDTVPPSAGLSRSIYWTFLYHRYDCLAWQQLKHKCIRST